MCERQIQLLVSKSQLCETKLQSYIYEFIDFLYMMLTTSHVLLILSFNQSQMRIVGLYKQNWQTALTFGGHCLLL